MANLNELSELTKEAKTDINRMLGNEGSSGSSFTSQIETTEGLTLGVGTENEEGLTAEELKGIKDNSNKMNIIWRNSFPVGTFTSKTPIVIPLYLSESRLSSLKKYLNNNIGTGSYNAAYLSLADYKLSGDPLYVWDIDISPVFKMGNDVYNTISKNQIVTLTDVALVFYNKTESDITINNGWGGTAIMVYFTKWFEN